ncbi:hypothetical protein BX600DRAFT_227290 [Xylariales sp. PMI_506]|nr:hypothetical protein BX600DRAFT_227290 [Xylariales sp. PMI_506]
MEVLREISRSCDRVEQSDLPSDEQKEEARICDISVFSAIATESEDLATETSEPLSRKDLNIGVQNGDLFQSNTVKHNQASLNLIFLPKRDWKATSQNRAVATSIFNFLKIDPVMTYYLMSHRSGWYFVKNPDGGYSFMIKDYLYMLAWSFHPETLETRALLAERSEYCSHSSLRTRDRKFGIPGLRKAHLYHPLFLAYVGLVDFVFYFDFVIIDGSVNIGDVEKSTGHGFWVKVQERQSTRVESKPDTEIETNLLVKAQRDIVAITGVFANLWKSVSIAKTVAETLDNLETWERTFLDLNPHADCRNYHQECAKSIRSAVGLLKLRIKTIEQSGKAIDDRAAAQSNIVSALLLRVDNGLSHSIAVANTAIAEATMRDSKDMKAIAIMTMAFLPSTFVAALFAVPSLQWTEANVIQDNFWVYWAFSIPTTILVFVIWDFFNNMAMFNMMRMKFGFGEKVDLDLEKGTSRIHTFRSKLSQD